MHAGYCAAFPGALWPALDKVARYLSTTLFNLYIYDLQAHLHRACPDAGVRLTRAGTTPPRMLTDVGQLCALIIILGVAAAVRELRNPGLLLLLLLLLLLHDWSTRRPESLADGH
jgi:hypothetical protein